MALGSLHRTINDQAIHGEQTEMLCTVLQEAAQNPFSLLGRDASWQYVDFYSVRIHKSQYGRREMLTGTNLYDFMGNSRNIF